MLECSTWFSCISNFPKIWLISGVQNALSLCLWCSATKLAILTIWGGMTDKGSCLMWVHFFLCKSAPMWREKKMVAGTFWLSLILYVSFEDVIPKALVIFRYHIAQRSKFCFQINMIEFFQYNVKMTFSFQTNRKHFLQNSSTTSWHQSLSTQIPLSASFVFTYAFYGFNLFNFSGCKTLC